MPSFGALTNLPRCSVLGVVLALLLTACGVDPQARVAAGKAYLLKDEFQPAIIELKSALQADPDLAEARLLLGKAFLGSGLAALAQVELRKALDLGTPEDLVYPEVARALLLDGNFRAVVDEFEKTRLKSPLAQADLGVSVATAYGNLGQADKARQIIDQALQSAPDYGPARTFRIRLAASAGNLEEALTWISRELVDRPDDHEGWILKGDLLLRARNDHEAALEAYRRALAVRPRDLHAHSNAMSVLVETQDKERAREQLIQMSKAVGGHPLTLYFAGRVALLEHQPERAYELAQKLLGLAPNDPRSAFLAGMVAYDRKQYIQAERFLLQAKNRAPTSVPTLQMLGATYLHLGQPAKALGILEPLLRLPRPNPTVYALVAQAHLQSGNLNEAETAFAQAARLNPNDIHSKAALALARVQRGDVKAALADLRQVAAADTGMTADLALVSALLHQKDYVAALEAIAKLETKSPDDPTAAAMRARVLLLQGDRTAAAQAFEHALTLRPSFLPAAVGLAELALAANDRGAALARIDALVKASPGSASALLVSAAVRERTGAAPKEVMDILRLAGRADPRDPGARLALINYSLSVKDPRTALEAAQIANNDFPDHAGVVDALGRSLAASGDRHQAIAAFHRLTQLMPQSPLPHLRIADQQVASNDLRAAAQSLHRALEVQPGALQIQVALARVHVAAKAWDLALGVARDIRSQRPGEAAGYLLEGSIEEARGRLERALGVYREGLARLPGSGELAMRTHQSLIAAGRERDAAELEARWLGSHPRDAAFHLYLAEAALARKQVSTAERHYLEVVKLKPNNPLALNNAASLSTMLGNSGGLELAERANELRPKQPAIMDTLAMAMASQGRSAEALKLIRSAVELDKDNPLLRLSLAKILLLSGEKVEADAALRQLAALGPTFDKQDEVTKLLEAAPNASGSATKP